MQTREATQAEIQETLARKISSGEKISFRHFLRECAMRTARNGVRHVQYAKSRVTIIEGEACVTYRGEVEKLAAKHWTVEDKTGLFDFRIKSEYLP